MMFAWILILLATARDVFTWPTPMPSEAAAFQVQDALLRRGPLLTRRSALLLPALAVPKPARAGPATYDAYAPTYDALDGGVLADALGLTELRRAAVPEAPGRDPPRAARNPTAASSPRQKR